MDEHEPERRGLAYRRHQRDRARGRARYLVHVIWGYLAEDNDPDGLEWEQFAQRLVNRLTVDRTIGNSPHTCWWGLRTPQERRAALNEKDQREDLT